MTPVELGIGGKAVFSGTIPEGQRVTFNFPHQGLSNEIITIESADGDGCGEELYVVRQNEDTQIVMVSPQSREAMFQVDGIPVEINFID